MSRYRIAQEADGRRWIITNGDGSLVWQGSHWISRETTGAHYLVSFADIQMAERYAKTILGDADER